MAITGRATDGWAAAPVPLEGWAGEEQHKPSADFGGSGLSVPLGETGFETGTAFTIAPVGNESESPIVCPSLANGKGTLYLVDRQLCVRTDKKIIMFIVETRPLSFSIPKTVNM
jgi:hypothetical protein